MACLETRTYVLPTVTVKVRRYCDEVGRSRTTCEVPIELWNQLATKCGETGLVVTRASAAEITAKTAAKRQKALSLLDAGWKIIAVAHELGLSESAVRKYNRKRKENGLR